jgi:hypothetical protein
MSLYWAPNPLPPDNAPRLHALIIGVGDYHHLGLNAAQPSKLLSGLAPLTATPLAAKRIARWLETEYDNAALPLGSIELLLSPAEKLTRADDSTVDIEEATMANIYDSFNRWYAQCNASKDKMAFFYFAGHGISTVSQFLLPADFGDPNLPNDWENCIDFTGMQTGMKKCAAQNQLFFVDACRDAPIEALIQRNPQGRQLVNSSIQDEVNLSAGYFASSSNRKAYGRDGEETFFCKALISCLQGLGARKAGPEWQIDTAGLSLSLVSVIEVMAAMENLPLSADCPVEKPVVFHFPKKAAVLLKIDCEPAAAKIESAISVTQATTRLESPRGEPRPWVKQVEAGQAKIEVTFTSYPTYSLEDIMMPPVYRLPVRR